MPLIIWPFRVASSDGFDEVVKVPCHLIQFIPIKESISENWKNIFSDESYRMPENMLIVFKMVDQH